MPTNLPYEMIFNITFLGIIGLGFLIGMIRGLRKSLYSLVVMAVFYAVFFLTIDLVVNQLWVMPLPFVFANLGGVMPGLGDAVTLGDALSITLEAQFGDMVGDLLTNEQFVSFVTGIALFVIKLVYTIVYFTVVFFLYRLITWIIRLMFFGRTQAEEDYKLAVRQIKKMKLKGRDLRKMKKSVRMDFKKMTRKERHQQIKADKRLNKRSVRNKEFKRIKKETKLAIKQMTRKERRLQTKEEKRRQDFILKNGYYFTDRQLTQYMNKPSKLPLMGALAGGAKGVLTVFVTMIMLGGMVNIMESLLQVFPEDTPTVSREYIEEVYLANSPVASSAVLQPMATTSPFAVPAGMEDTLGMAREIIDAFNTNLVVSNLSTITYTDENYTGEVPLHLYLFDSVLSFDYREERIMLRNELDTFSDTAAVLMNSEYATSNDLADISQEDIIALFDTISNSRLITTLLPVIIEAGSEVYDVPVEVPIEELYAIDWQSELQALGSVAAVGFGLINAAGILNDEADLTQVTLDGDEVQGFFDSLSNSELVTLTAYVAVEPLLEQMGGQMSAIITVPDDIVWEDEFAAFGLVAKAVLDTGITMDQLTQNDPTALISALSDLDFTVLLNSEIVTQAMINIFSGAAGIEGLDMIIIPAGINWRDLVDGEDLIRGELYNILNAINALTDIAEGFSFDNISLSVIADFDEATIDTIFESDVLVATISNFITNELDFGDTPLVIPDSVFDTNGYITNVEMKAVANSARVLVTDLPCAEGDVDCESVGFDLGAVFTLSTGSIDTMVGSDIIAATIGNLIIDQAGDVLTIPSSALDGIIVDSVQTFVVSPGEISSLFASVSVLEFEDLDTLEFDVGILNRLALETDPTVLDETKTDTLFGSLIVHATISNMLIDLQDTDDILAIPYFAEDDITAVRYTDSEDGMEYISTDELDNILQALISLDITDFNNIDTLDLNTIIDNSAEILASSILQATISKQVFELGSDTVTVPVQDQDGGFVRVSVGDPLAETDTEYITVDEINAILDALVVLDATDIQNFSGDVDIQAITSEEGNITRLLNSATIHATISQQLINLAEPTDPLVEAALVVPYYEEDNTTQVRLTVGPVGFETEYIVKSEIEAMIDVLELLGITSNLEEFDGSVNLSTVLGDPTSYDTLLASSTIQATISQQLLDLEADGTLKVPYFQEDNTTRVRRTVGVIALETNTEYITEAEIRALLDVLDLLGIADNLDTFDGSVDLSLVLGDPTNYDTLLASATIHATISQQLFDLETDGSLAVPYLKQDDTTEVRLTVGNPINLTTTEYITADEVRALLDVLDLLGIADDLSNFDGSVDLSAVLGDPTNYDILLASATIHATISQQLFDLAEPADPLQEASLVVPFFEADDTTLVRLSVGDALAGTDTNYIVDTEVRALLDVLDLLGIADNLDTFDGSVNLSLVLGDSNNYDTLLASATIHATISQQLFDLETDGTLRVPYLKEDDATLVRVSVGDPVEETDTEFITDAEVRALLDVLDLLGIADNLDTFDGSVNLGTVLGDPANYDILLASATIHATISQQLFDLGAPEDPLQEASLVVPFFEEDSSPVRVTVGVGIGHETEYVMEAEVRALLDVLDLLGISDNLDTFNGDIDMGTVLADPANYDILLASSTIHATISKQLFDLDVAGTLVVPYEEEDDTTAVRILVGDALAETDTEYITEVEVRALLNALDVLGLTDNLEQFDGGVDIASATQVPGNTAILLGSSTIQATISKQLIDLDITGDVQLPFWRENGSTYVRRLVTATGGQENEFVSYDELEALIEAMNVLGITGDVSSFDASSVDLSILGEGTNADTVFLSAMIQATVSKQVIDLITDPSLTDTFVVPYLKDDDITEIRFSVGDELLLTNTDYVLKSELVNLVKGMDLLGITDVTTFSGNIDLNTFFDPTNRAVLLASSTMQATISAQLLEIDDNTLDVPFVDVSNTTVRIKVADGDLVKEFEYITVDEIDAIFGAFKELNITNFDNFTGTIDISVLDTEAKQDAVLASASIHAKISTLLTDLPSDVLIVPMYSQAGETLGNEIRIEQGSGGQETEYVVKGEVKALMNAFTAMGFTDLNNFGTEIGSGAFFSERATLLLSSSIQATISNKMINGTGGELVVPDQDVRPVTAFDIRLVHADGVVYIEINELNYIFDGLESLGLTDFTTMSFNPGALFSQDLNALFNSASIQATISKNILDNAIDETGPLADINNYISGTLVVPTALREAIAIDGSGSEHIEKTELIELLGAMEALGFTSSFGDGVGGSSITSMDDLTLDEMFDSGTIHTTIHFMLEKNTGIDKPDQAKTNLSFLNNITTEAEIRYFLDALNALGQADFSNASFGLAAFNSIASASDRDTIATSMIARATLHDEVEPIATNVFLYPTGVTAADYMDADTNTFFIKSTFLDVVNTVNPPTLP